MIRLTRRYGFPAAHVLRHASFSDAENERVYGKCANPNGHGHNYGVEVSVEGPLDRDTGRIVDPDTLDALFEDTVASRLSHRMLNDDEWFRERVPTAEHIAVAIHEALDPAIAKHTTARLAAVRVIETAKNSFVYGDLS